MYSDLLSNKCKAFAEFGHEDMNANEPISDCFHLMYHLKSLENESIEFNISAWNTLIKRVEVATKIFLVVTVCTRERLFYQLKERNRITNDEQI